MPYRPQRSKIEFQVAGVTHRVEDELDIGGRYKPPTDSIRKPILGRRFKAAEYPC